MRRELAQVNIVVYGSFQLPRIDGVVPRSMDTLICSTCSASGDSRKMPSSFNPVSINCRTTRSICVGTLPVGATRSTSAPKMRTAGSRFAFSPSGIGESPRSCPETTGGTNIFSKGIIFSNSSRLSTGSILAANLLLSQMVNSSWLEGIPEDMTHDPDDQLEPIRRMSYVELLDVLFIP